jgi:hypothetical protein
MGNKNKIFLTILSTLIVCSGMISTTTILTVKGDSYDTIVVECDFPLPTFEQVKIDNEWYDRITMGVLPNSCDMDAARLPIKPLKVLLPFGRMIDSITVVVKNNMSMGSGFNVEKGQKIIPLASNEMIDNGFNGVDVSNQLFTVVGTYVWRGYTILFVNLHPVQYITDSGEIIWYDHMTLQVKTQPTSMIKSVRNMNQDKDLVLKEIVNPQVITTYEDAPCLAPLDSVEYVIITNEALKEASGAYTFQDLVTAKQNEGMTADIFTVEDIVANTEYWVDGAWGDNNPSNPFYSGEIQGSTAKFNDTSAKIRNFIRYAYTELGTEYVLLGGDADYSTSDNIVPLRKLFAVEDGLPLGSLDLIEEDIPSDVYYACLDGNFNSDGDTHWGENATQNGYNDEDEADLLSEVYVGRACADAEDEVSNFVMKTLSYDASTDPYISTALMVGEYLGFSGVSTYGGNYKDLIIPMLPEDFVVNTLYDRDGTWSKYDLMNILNTETPHLINHLGHGNVQYGLKMGVSDIASLTNDKYFFVYSQTCLAGSFDNTNTDDCAAEYFTVETPHGAFAVIMNARYGLASENTLVSPSQGLDESFFTALFTENLHALGQANHYSKEDHIWHINENGIRWVYYETNLFGDPALRIKPYNYPPETPPAPNGPDSGIINTQYTFTATTTDPEGEQISYMFDWGDGTTSDWIGPYTSGVPGSALHQWTEAGTYDVKVKAKDIGGGESGWSVAHSMTIYSTPQLQIEDITGGLFKVKATIKNTGFVDADHVQWSMTLVGGAFIGKEAGGTIIGIPAGEERTVSSGLIIGFGKTIITVTISCDGSSDTKDQNATILLFFINVKT